MSLLTSADPLYAHTAVLQELDAQLAESGGELTPEMEAALTAADGAWEEKVERVALYVRSLEHTADACKGEARRLAERAGTHERSANSLKQYLLTQLQLAGKSSVVRPLATVAIQANSSPSVTSVLTDDDLGRLYWAGDAALVRYKASYTLDAAVVKQRAESGVPLPAGVSLSRGSHLRIR